jgi:hypothetical protein
MTERKTARGIDYFVSDSTTGMRVKYWYDFNVKLWALSPIDADGYQIGTYRCECTKAETKRSALDMLNPEHLSRRYIVRHRAHHCRLRRCRAGCDGTVPLRRNDHPQIGDTR